MAQGALRIIHHVYEELKNFSTDNSQNTMPPYIVCEKMPILRGHHSISAPVTLHISPSSMIILKGENGSGKTTLLMTLAGLLPISNTYSFNEKVNISTQTSEIFTFQKNAETFFLPQSLCLLEEASVLDNLKFFGHMMHHNKILDSLKLREDPFEVLPLRQRLVKTLSHGQKQRVSLSRLCFTTAPLWLLDEPDQGLDEKSHEKLHGFLKKHLKKGGACVMASHIF